MTKKSEGTVSSINFRRLLYTKQGDESQNDSFGSLMKEVVLVKEGQENIYLQKEGSPIGGVVPNKDRQLIKLIGLPWFVSPGSQKGGGYVATLAAYQTDIKRITKGLAKAGFGIEYLYGTKSSRLVVTSPVNLYNMMLYLILMDQDTLEKYPPELSPGKDKDTGAKEETALVFEDEEVEEAEEVEEEVK